MRCHPHGILLFSTSLLAALIGLAATPAMAATVIPIAAGDSTALQNAIQTVADGDIIELADGTYTAPSPMFEIINPGKRFTIRAADGATAILDGAGLRPVLRYAVSNSALRGEVIFQDLNFRNGRSTTNGMAGGVTIVEGAARFERCDFIDNVSDASVTGGGGVGVFGDDTGSVTAIAFFDECTFNGNTAKNEGGGLKLGESALGFVHRAQFIDNRVNLADHRDSAAGGGIHVGNSFLQISNSRFESNQAGYVGGAIYTLGTWEEPPGDFLERRAETWIANSTFTGNISEAHASITPPSPPVGGAIHGENQMTYHVYNSRFVDNQAELGGAFNLFRAMGVIESSVFIGNFVTGLGAGNGFGGAIGVVSNDGPENGTTNYLSAGLTLTDSFVQGRSGETVAQNGGGISANGDTWRHFGLGGVPAGGTPAQNHAQVVIDNVIFADLDVAETQGVAGTGVGGAIDATFVDMSIDNSLILDSNAIGDADPSTSGGGIRVIAGSEFAISNSYLVDNSSDQRGGALSVHGSDLQADSCWFAHNEVGSPGTFDHLGAGIYTVPIPSLWGDSFDVTGKVENSILTSQVGIPIYDGDLVNGPISDLRFNNNTVFNTHPTWGQSAYFHGFLGNKSVAELNTLLVDRTAPTPDTEKSQVNNLTPGSEPIFGAISRAPLQILNETAAGDPTTDTDAYIGYAWSGGAATVNGAPVGGNSGWQSVGVGTHTLSVTGASSETAQITAGPTPTATLTSTPPFISSGESATLDWDVTAGTFVKAELDFLGSVSSSGSQQVTPDATTTYHLYALTKEGGIFEEVTVYVDELPGQIFVDGFESGDLSAW